MLFGAHVKRAGGLPVTLRRAEAMGAEVMQVFPQSPRQWRHPKANAERAAAFAQLWPASAVVRAVVCHAPYLINLGTANEDIYEKSCASLADNLRAAATMGASALVVHIGSHLGAGLTARLDAIASGIRRRSTRPTARCCSRTPPVRANDRPVVRGAGEGARAGG